MPVQGNHVYFPGLFLDGWERRSRKVHGVKRPIQRHPLKPFLDAVKAYRECFAWVPKGKKFEPRRVADDAKLEAFREQGKLTEELVRQTLAKISKE